MLGGVLLSHEVSFPSEFPMSCRLLVRETQYLWMFHHQFRFFYFLFQQLFYFSVWNRVIYFSCHRRFLLILNSKKVGYLQWTPRNLTSFKVLKDFPKITWNQFCNTSKISQVKIIDTNLWVLLCFAISGADYGGEGGLEGPSPPRNNSVGAKPPQEI